jgi:hypothetical protein
MGIVGGCSLLAPDDAELLGGLRDGSAGEGGLGSDPGAGDGGNGGTVSDGSGGVRQAAGGTGGRPSNGGNLSDASVVGTGGNALDADAPDACTDAAPSCTGVVQPSPPLLPGIRLDVHCGAAVSSTADSCHIKAATTCPPEGYQGETHVTMTGISKLYYAVTLRIRGVVEPKVYMGGVPVVGSQGHFYSGGTAAGNPIYNTYGLTISDPPQSYFLNAGEEGELVLPIDYTQTVTIRAGAAVTVYTHSRNCAESYDCKDLSLAPKCPEAAPLTGVTHLTDKGQFVQVDFEKAGKPTTVPAKDPTATGAEATSSADQPADAGQP